MNHERNSKTTRAWWIALASLWALGGLVAFAITLATDRAELDSAILILLSLVIGAVGFILRWPLTRPGQNMPESAVHAIWLLVSLGQCNWLGTLLLRSEPLLDFLLAATLVLSMDFILQRLIWRAESMPWLKGREWRAQLLRRWTLFREQAATGKHKQVGPALYLADVGSDEEEAEINEELEIRGELGNGVSKVDSELSGTVLSESIRRQSSEGVDEQGAAYQAGSVRVEMVAEQATETVLIGFFPPFVGQPQVELECDQEDVSMRLVHCTPLGTRVHIRRSQATDSVSFWLQWFAVQRDSPPLSPPRSLP